jgi:orotate phosphoribosyltransferase
MLHFTKKEGAFMTYKEEFITFMVRSGVLTFGDFTTKSGRKTPYFVNTGNYKTGAQAAKLGDYYAACIQENLPEGIDCLFGPAYKGIPLAVTTAASLYRNYDRDLPYCFNRKEAKDHGEGGSMVGYKPQDGDRVAIIEDVVTAGTAVRESIELFKSVADVKIVALFVSADRMERGTRECTTLDELRKEYGIQVYPIVTVRDIIAYLHNRPVDGKVYIDDEMKGKMEAYLAEYGPRA